MDRQRKIFLGKCVAVLSVVPVLIRAHAAGPDPGKAGVPGESTCNEAGCHVGTPLNGGSGSVSIDAGGSSYVPGVKQRIKVTVIDPTQRRWGFQLTARLASDPTKQAGVFTNIDNTTQQICSGADLLEVRCTGNPALRY